MPPLKRDAPVEPVDISILKSMTFQERLAIGIERLKAERGVTNKVLGEQLGLDEPYISRLARALADVKLSTLDKMKRAWDVDDDDLLKFTEADLPLIAAWMARQKKKKLVKRSP